MKTFILFLILFVIGCKHKYATMTGKCEKEKKRVAACQLLACSALGKDCSVDAFFVVFGALCPYSRECDPYRRQSISIEQIPDNYFSN